ncbi:MAG: flavin reductase family protein [Trueperaceae bacterium]|nr:flavin reductase family protein [Trueperaceae bacterium]
MKELDVGAVWRLLKPEVVAWAVAEHDGQRSICPLGWTMRTSATPPMVAISVAPSRFTHGLIEGAGAFVLAYPGRELAQATATCGSRSGREVDKFAETGVTTLPALRVAAPVVAECVANLECRVVDRFATGDHTIFVGEVVAAWAQDEPGKLLCLVDESAGYETVLADERFRFGVVRG